jgi:starch-binding outer membrane protein, SusD/RagB family
MNDMKIRSAATPRRGGAALYGWLVALGVLTASSCDFAVVNPGPIQDENLNDAGAHFGLVNGGRKATLVGLASAAHYSGGAVRELKPSGGVGAGGMDRDWELGVMNQDHTLPGTGDIQQGRWISEHAVERLTGVLGAQADSYALLGQAYLWAGYANRILGETQCVAIIDGGAVQPYTTYFTRAIAHFDKAEAIATKAGDNPTRLAAIGGRAAAHASLGNWNAAATDAAKVPVDFTFRQAYTNEQRYRITEAINGFYRSTSLVQTWAEQYFLNTGDPRVAWGHDASTEALKYGETPRATTGKTLFYYPLKFYAPRNPQERTVFKPDNLSQYSLPVNLTTGREMLLIRAEAALAGGNLTQAMDFINQVRTRNQSYFTGAALAPVTAATLEAGWTALKFERAVELHLEGRRMGDRRRWAEKNTPGALQPLEFVPASQATQYSVQRMPALCSPVSLGEKETNSNVPIDFQDTIVREPSAG